MLAICVPLGSALGVGSALLVDRFDTGTEPAAAQGDDRSDADGKDEQANDSGKDYEPDERNVDGRMSAADWKSFGTCGLLTAKDLRWAAPTGDPDLPVRPIERRASEHSGKPGKRRESCEYGAGVEDLGGALRIEISQWRPDFGEDVQTEKASGLGKGAVFVMDERSEWLVVPHRDLYMVLDGPSPTKKSGRTLSDIRSSLVETAKTALDRMPEKVTFPARVESKLCADFDRKAVAKALGSKIGLSRSLHSDLVQNCTFLSASQGKKDPRTRLGITVNPRPSYASVAELGIGREQSVDIVEGVDAYWSSLGLVLSGTERTVTLQYYPDGQVQGFGTDKLPPPPKKLIAVARSVADVYGLRSPGPRKPANDGPCALLTTKEAGSFGYRGKLPATARYVDAAGARGIPVDTCAYDNSSVGLFSTRADLLVQASAQHFEPVRAEHEEPKRKPIDDLGDKAYVVTDGSDTAAVVRRGKHQLTVRPVSIDPNDPADLDNLIGTARRANERWKPGRVAVEEASGPCAEIGREEISDAVGTDVTHVRGLALRPGHRCAYTTVSGEVLFVDTHRTMGLSERSVAIDNGRPVDGLHGFAQRDKLVVLDKTTPAGIRVTLWTPVEHGFEHARIGDRHTQVGKLFADAFFDG